MEHSHACSLDPRPGRTREKLRRLSSGWCSLRGLTTFSTTVSHHLVPALLPVIFYPRRMFSCILVLSGIAGGRTQSKATLGILYLGASNPSVAINSSGITVSQRYLESVALPVTTASRSMYIRLHTHGRHVTRISRWGPNAEVGVFKNSVLMTNILHKAGFDDQSRVNVIPLLCCAPLGKNLE